MVKHIVLWTFREHADGRSKQENIKMAADILNGLKSIIPTVKHMEIGRNFTKSDGAFDLALYSEFDDEAGLEVYQKHPEHLKAAEFLRKVRDQRVITDYKI